MKKPTGHLCFKVYFNWNTVYVLRLIYFTLEPFALQKHNNVYEFPAHIFICIITNTGQIFSTHFQTSANNRNLMGMTKYTWKKKNLREYIIFLFSYFNLGILCHFCASSYYYCCYFLRGYYIFVRSLVLRSLVHFMRTRTFFRSLRSSCFSFSS